MTKQQLVDTVAKDANLAEAQARAALEAFVQPVERSLKVGEKVSLVSFGSFVTLGRPERDGRSPRRGKPIKIPPRRGASFRAGASPEKAIDWPGVP